MRKIMSVIVAIFSIISVSNASNLHQINSFSFNGEAILTSGDGVGVGKIFHYIKEQSVCLQLFRVYLISIFHHLIIQMIVY